MIWAKLDDQFFAAGEMDKVAEFHELRGVVEETLGSPLEPLATPYR